ncbi:hypothetical protein BKA61DRAFT_647030 [Leptodontidium sp. MPI-SDFR-AT-0119]|nr:hypothetical protein BKA61DRAFT_647030 [Leptodontidium sp. MPI-SDFR-AT-0119]
MPSPFNKPVPNVPFFMPTSPLPPGSAVNLGPSTPTLFTPLKIRSLTFQNRIFVAPMCQYSTSPYLPTIGALTPYHVVTLGQYALKGSSLVFIEATAVTGNGRISPNDSGLWEDRQIEGVRKVCEFVHSVGGKVGIQLAHAGRKASTVAPWLGRERGKSVVTGEDVGGWPGNVVAPSAIAWSKEGYNMPREMTVVEIKEVVEAFAAAARRATLAGVDVIEIHGAHGYLLSSFNSPISNQRSDSYGGSFENRTRICREVICAVRSAIPASTPLFYRITSTEWMEDSPIAKGRGSWDVESSIRFAKLLPELGVDLLDRIMPHTNYQVQIAGRIRRELKISGLPLLIGAVGMITDAEQARDIVQGCDSTDNLGPTAIADAILVARQFMREPEWVLRVAWWLGVEVQWPVQFGRGRFLKGSKI